MRMPVSFLYISAVLFKDLLWFLCIASTLINKNLNEKNQKKMSKIIERYQKLMYFIVQPNAYPN